LVRKYSLPNGITLLCERMPRVETVSIGLWQRVGSVCEESANNGATHFVEHMLFKGTSRYSAREIAMRTDSVGANMNAYTTREKTCFYANVMAPHFPMIADLLRDMYYDSTFPKEEIAREKEVVLQEIDMYEDSPDDSVHDQFIAQLWPSHPLGFSISGKPENIKAIRRDALMRFYKKHYVTDRLIVSLAGAIDPEEMRERFSAWPPRYAQEQKGAWPPRYAQEQKGAWPPRYAEGNHAIPPIPPIAYTLYSQQKPLEQVHLLLAMPGIPKAHPWRFAIALLNQIWGGSMSSRLFQRIREECGICYSIYTFPAMMHETGFFGIYCASSDRYLDKVLTLIKRENERLLRKGITPEELRCAKEQLKSSVVIGRESVETRMNTNALDELILGRREGVRELLRKIEGAAIDEVHAVIAHILGEGRYAARTLGPKNTMPILKRHFPGVPHARG